MLLVFFFSVSSPCVLNQAECKWGCDGGMQVNCICRRVYQQHHTGISSEDSLGKHTKCRVTTFTPCRFSTVLAQIGNRAMEHNCNPIPDNTNTPFTPTGIKR